MRHRLSFAVLINGFEDSARPFTWLIEAVELIARRHTSLGPRYESPALVVADEPKRDGACGSLADDLLDPLTGHADDARDRGEALPGFPRRNDRRVELRACCPKILLGAARLRGRAANTCQGASRHLPPRIGEESDLHFPRKGYFHLTVIPTAS